MSKLIIRTEDIKDEDLFDIFVESQKDRQIINRIKTEKQTLIIGSRGSGKTMLLKVVQKELSDDFQDNRILPVYLSFSKILLVKDYPLYWMFSKILTSFRHSLLKFGIITENNNPFKGLFHMDTGEKNSLDDFINILEESYRDNKSLGREEIIEILGIDPSNVSIIDDVDFLKRIIQTFCKEYSIKSVLFLFDEACHNFIPEQQRMFFSIFRDMRDPYISCSAAVYPGISNYGTIQMLHDVNSIRIERDINDTDYINDMREIISNQLDGDQYEKLSNYGKELNSLIVCSGGNPRLLIRSIEIASNNFKSLSRGKVNETIKDFYRNRIWKEHIKLSEIYTGHKEIIDWGRKFLEEYVLPETLEKNKKRKPQQSIYFCIHRDSPEIVKRSIRILEYSGIIFLHTEATKVRKNIYDRYQINLGTVVAFSTETKLSDYSMNLYNGLSVKLFTDFGKSSPSYKGIIEKPALENENVQSGEILNNMLEREINSLPITERQIEELNLIGINTIKDVLTSREESLQDAYQIGPSRSRSIYNKAYSAVIEFISG